MVESIDVVLHRPERRDSRLVRISGDNVTTGALNVPVGDPRFEGGSPVDRSHCIAYASLPNRDFAIECPDIGDFPVAPFQRIDGGRGLIQPAASSGEYRRLREVYRIRGTPLQIGVSAPFNRTDR